MNIAIPILLLAFSTQSLMAADFDQQSAFESVDAFVVAAKAFRPATTRSDLSAVFTVPELGQPEDPKTGKPITATSIQSSISLWSNETAAVVFVSAAPPTEATRSTVGVLFLITRSDKSWRISDSVRFVATGKDSGITAEQTAYAPTGLGKGGNAPVFTVVETQGGRGYAYSISASYRLSESKLEGVELK